VASFFADYIAVICVIEPGRQVSSPDGDSRMAVFCGFD
jgi:hypothetical protein